MAQITLADFEREALGTLLEYSTIPCLSPNYDTNWVENGHLERSIQLLAEWARGRKLADFEVEIHRLDGRTPLLCVTVEATCDAPGTAVLYGHLDKQPPLGEWSDGLSPFSPVRRGDRVFARGIADDGYSTFSALLALEALEANRIGHSRCIVLIEASEESGSTDLDAYLDELTPHLGDVQLMVCLDSGALTYDRLWVTTSLRGIVNLEVKISVLAQGQHSGSASGVVPSSFRLLRRLLSRVEDEETGEILVRELQADIPESQRQAAAEIAAEFGDIIAHELPTLEGVQLMGSSPQDRILRRTWFPTLSVVGVGGIPAPPDAGNVLRPFTTAVLSFRLPPTVDAKSASEKLEEIFSEGPTTDVTIVQYANGWTSPELAPWLANALEEASMEAFGRRPGFTGEGGSIPFLASLGERFPAAQFVATGVLGPKSNAHGIDEMLDLPMAVGVTNAVITVLGAFAKKEEQS